MHPKPPDLLAMNWDASGELDREHHRLLLHLLADEQNDPATTTPGSGEANGVDDCTLVNHHELTPCVPIAQRS